MSFTVGQPQQSGLDVILEGFGKGVGAGIEAGMQNRLQTMLKGNETEITPQDVAKLGSQFLDKNQFSQISLEEWQKISDDANQRKSTEGPSQAIFSSFKNFLESEEEIPLLTRTQIDDRNKEQEETVNKYLQALKKGSESGIAGKIAAISPIGGQERAESFAERLRPAEDANFLQRFLHGTGRIGADLPYYLTGGRIGAALGAPVGPIGAAAGGTIGTFAFPAMLNAGLDEYQKFLDTGGKASFGDFLKRAEKVELAGVEAGAESLIFSGMGKLIGPLTKKFPAFKKLFEMKKGGKALEAVAASALQTTGIEGAQAVAAGLTGGELPTTQNVLDTFTQVLGLNLAHIKPNVWKKTAKRIQESGKTTEEVAQEVKEKGAERDLSKPAQLFKIVTDVTGEPTVVAKVAKEKISRVSPEKAAKVRQKEAEAIAKGPLEETLKKEEKRLVAKEKPLSEKETAKRKIATQQAKSIDSKISKVQEDIDFIRKSVEKSSKKERPMLEIVLKSKERELSEHERNKKDLESIAKRGTEAFIKERTEQKAEKRIKDLQRMAENVESESAQDMERQFERDQKYIDSLQDMLRKGILPEPSFYDRYIKELSLYQKAYENALKDLQSQIRNTAQPELLTRMKNFEKLLKRNLDINTAKIEKQKQKIGTLQRLKKPGSPMLRNLIANLRKDIPQLQKDLISYKKFTEGLDFKAKSVFTKATKSLEKYMEKPSKTSLKAAAENLGISQETVQESILPKNRLERLEKLGRNYLENPSAENLDKLAKETGLSHEKIKEFFDKKKMKELETIFEKAKDKMDAGEKTSKLGNWFKEAMSEYRQKGFPKIRKALMGALIMIPIQIASEKVFGKKLPATLLFFMLPGTRGIRFGATSVIYALLSAYSGISRSIERRKFRNLKTSREKIEYIRKMEKRGESPAKIKKIISSPA